VLGSVVEVWRYPVKSLGGERLDEPVAVDLAGLEGDRRLAVVDDATGKVLSAKTVPQLLQASAAWRGVDGVRITSADGTLDVSSADDDVAERLSGWLGRPVRLEAPVPGRRSHFDMDLDPDDERHEHTTELQTPPGVFFDSRSVLHLVTCASLGGRDRRRFRPNLVVDTGDLTGHPEDGWVGEWLRVGGDLDVAVRKMTARCVLVTRPQPGLEKDGDLLRDLVRQRSGNLGIYVDPQGPGKVAVGDAVLRLT
jgi:uncharacterized protein YcbX